MSDRSQLLKGVLEGCLLQLLEDETAYGYAIVERLKAEGFHEACEGTVYPLLLRLERSGLLASSKQASPYGPMRKYYTLTEEGERELQQFRRHWAELARSVDGVLHHRKGGISP